MRILVAFTLAWATFAWAAPHIPTDDRQVLERLPVRPSDPAAAELTRRRAEVAATPADPGPAVRLARHYFDLAMAQGDPRYVGYADAALRPWHATASRHAGILVARGLLRQYRHDFEGALQDLGDAAAVEPQN